MSPLLELRNVSKRFGPVKAVQDVSIQFNSGEVHAVIGENGAGKSTMMNIIAGEFLPDEGEVFVDGAPVQLTSSLASRAQGIRIVFQELSLCDNLTVGENVLLADFGTRHQLSILNTRRSGRSARQALDRLGLNDIATDTPLSALTIAQKQLVEIARAVSQNARILILDEPNSALSPRESARLFEIVRSLKDDGVSVIYISHHLQEVLDLADRISVMRDGQLTGETPVTESTSVDELVSLMVGRSLEAMEQYSTSADVVTEVGETILELHDFSVEGQIEQIDFSLSSGEIVGVAGLPDSGKDILAEAIFGLERRTGIVRINGIALQPNRPSHSIDAGISFVPADRRGAGALLEMSVAGNIVSSSLRRFTSSGLLKKRKVDDAATEQIRRLDARVAELGQRIATLSGGNQQKIIFARGLLNGPRLLILHEPTRGIDVGAKAEIYRILKSLAHDGMAILMISSELPEIVLHSGRVLVMAHGRITGQLSGTHITEENVMELAVGTPSSDRSNRKTQELEQA